MVENQIVSRRSLIKAIASLLLSALFFSSCTIIGYTAVGISTEAHNLLTDQKKILATYNCEAPSLTLMFSEITTPHAMASDTIKIVLDATFNGTHRTIGSTYVDFDSTDVNGILKGPGSSVSIYELFFNPNEAFKDWFVRVDSTLFTEDEYRQITKCLRQHSREAQNRLTESLNRAPSNKKAGFRIIGTFFALPIKPKSIYYCDANRENRIIVYPTGSVFYEDPKSKWNKSSVIGKLEPETLKIKLYVISLSSQKIGDYLSRCLSDKGLTINDEYQIRY